MNIGITARNGCNDIGLNEKSVAEADSKKIIH